MSRAGNLFLGLTLAALALPAASGAGIVAINEIVASNASGIADEDGDAENWIELYNYGTESVSLENWGLSDDYENPFRWIFPAGVEIGPGEFLLVWASGKNRDDPESELHTNFRIASAGEEVLLTAPSGVQIDGIPPTAIPTDISYGRWPDGTGEWFFFDEPTPVSSNTTQRYTEVLEPPVFSRPGGFYADAFDLEISHPDPEVTIVYTLDGSRPDIGNLEGTTYYYKNSYPQEPGQPFGEFLINSYRSRLYSHPLLIYDRSPEPDKLTQISSSPHYEPDYFPETPVRKGIVVRTKAFKENALPSPTGTNTYFIHSNENPSNLPVIALTTQETNLFEYTEGIYTPGANRDLGGPGNYHFRGEGWEREAHLEFFEPGAAHSAFNLDMGIRIHGGITREFAMKSLRLYARSIYGASRFEYAFFKEFPHSSFNRLILRNSGNDFSSTMFRDAAIQTIVGHLNFDTQAYRPAVHFINGEYWGIINVRERFDKHYLARVYGVDPENIDLLENNAVVKEGDAAHYLAMRNFIEDNDMSDESHYDFVKTQMDVKNFTDYQIANIFSANHDWPHRNIDYWRLSTDAYSPDNPTGHDGRWRWLLYDTDFGYGFFGNYTQNTLLWATAQTGQWTTSLLRNLLANYQFKIDFINRFADLLNTTFLPERTTSVINRLAKNIEAEIPEHIHRWSHISSLTKWQSNVKVMIEFAGQRPFYQRRHIRNFFDIEKDVNVTVDVSNRWHGHIRVNTIEIKEGTPGIEGNPYPWTGIYFSGIPIELEAIPAPGYKFSHWEGGVSSTDHVISVTPADALELKAYFTRSFESAAVYFWLFDTSLPNDTPLEEVAPTYSLGDGAVLSFHSALEDYPFSPGHENWRRASMERRNAPTALNYRPEANRGVSYEDTDMRGLQIRQPFVGDGGENTLIFHLPTEGFEEVVFSLAAKDEDAADSLLVDYSVSAEDPEWTTAGLAESVSTLNGDFELFELDFSAIPEADDNPGFKVRIRFQGSDMTAGEGDRVTFNNITLDGKPREGENLPPEVVGALGLLTMIEGGEDLRLDLDDLFNDPDNAPLSFGVAVDGDAVSFEVEASVLTLTPQERGGVVVTVTADDGSHPPAETSFRALVYPEAFRLDNSDGFAFTSWDADEPEGNYPENMLFLQGDRTDLGAGDPLIHPYFIPHDDYHEDDSVGFPYNNERRTRISGLGEDGISFINTGRGRDLGGALVALDTRGVGGVEVSWLAGTILRNEREYALRLQYRVGIDGPFLNLTADGGLVEYRPSGDGTTRIFADIPLPPDSREKEYVQLLWRYHHISGQSGPRAQLRLDDILTANYPIPTPVPTPGSCNIPLFVHRPVNMWIERTRSAYENGVHYFYHSDEYAGVADSRNEFGSNEPFIHYWDVNSVLVVSPGNESNFVSQAGDRILLTYLVEEGGNEQELWIYLPSAEDLSERFLQWGVNLYIGEDGSTYWDELLCDPAYLAPVPPPTPSPTLTPLPTSTATPYLPPPTPTPIITPSPVPIWIHDYDGDGTSDIAVFRPGSGLWAVRGLTRVYFGSQGDLPVPGDYDGDGTTDIAVFRGRSGLWAVRGLTRVYFGAEGDIPVPGDYTGEGTSGVAVFRESSGLWAVRGLTRVYFGGLGDLPVSGYYSGEGKKAIGVYRPSSGLWAIQGLTRVYFGTEGDIPVSGDYGRRGRWAPSIFRPASGLWAVRGVTRVYFGTGGDLPVPGGYGGDGVDRPGIFRPASGLWAVRGLTRVYFGTGGDIPAAR